MRSFSAPLRKTGIVLLLTVGLSLPAFGGSGGDSATAARLRDQALSDNTAWDMLQSLCYEIGPRPAASPAFVRARDWAVAKMRALGFTNVHAEAFAKPYWERGTETATLIAPYALKLSVIGLGGSVPTPAGGLEAEVTVLPSLATLEAAGANAFVGKIVLINQPMVRAEDGSGYSADVAIRYAASEAAKRGAVGYLIRSVSTGTGRAPHTGHMTYADGVAKIPAAALGVPDADLISYLVTHGTKVRVKLDMQSVLHPDTQSWNVSGEIRGREMPDEVVVIGGHLDSWDNGLGAIDDGTGVAITTAAAKLIGSLPQKPRRTIRVVMWGSEETGGASEAYIAAHKAEAAKIVATSESDEGPDRIFKVRLPEGAAALPAFQKLSELLAPIRVMSGREPSHGAGADVEGLVDAGVPAFSFQQDASRYFDYHHSADDTPAIVDQTSLRQNVAAWAVLSYLIADTDVSLRVKK